VMNLIPMPMLTSSPTLVLAPTPLDSDIEREEKSEEAGTALHFTVLYCSSLYCTVLYGNALNSTLLYSAIVYGTALHCAALCYTVRTDAMPSELIANLIRRDGERWRLG
jgi:hypothetical protein